MLSLSSVELSIGVKLKSSQAKEKMRSTLDVSAGIIVTTSTGSGASVPNGGGTSSTDAATAAMCGKFVAFVAK